MCRCVCTISKLICTPGAGTSPPEPPPPGFPGRAGCGRVQVGGVGWARVQSSAVECSQVVMACLIHLIPLIPTSGAG